MNALRQSQSSEPAIRLGYHVIGSEVEERRMSRSFAENYRKPDTFSPH